MEIHWEGLIECHSKKLWTMAMELEPVQNVWKGNLIHPFTEINKPRMDLDPLVKHAGSVMLQNGIQKIEKDNQLEKKHGGKQIKKNTQKKKL